MRRLSEISDEKLRAFFVDLYADLRDRRLLPLVALLVVGIIAAPILLKDKGEGSPPAPAPAPAAGSSEASFAVVPAQPELQGSKRLGKRTPRNPFHPPTASPPTAEGSASPPVAASAGTGAEASVTTGETSVTKVRTVHTTTPGPVRYVPVPITFGIDALLGVSGNPHERRGIRPQTRLPSAKNPVLVYMGASKDKHHALFLPSFQVLSYTGPVHCAAMKADCQLLEVGLGAPVDFVYGAQEKHFTITVERLVPIVLLPNGKERVVEPDRHPSGAGHGS